VRARAAPSDHWALLATAAVLARVDDAELRGLYLDHASLIAENMLAEQIRAPDDPSLDGAFHAEGTLCPVSIRLEGLSAALRFLPAGPDDPDYTPERADLRTRIRAAVVPSVNLLLRYQAKEGPLAGGIPRATRPLPRIPLDNLERLPAALREARLDKDGYARRFNARMNEVRVDYVQHALAAFIAVEGEFQ
jgi:hypothetical protein